MNRLSFQTLGLLGVLTLLSLPAYCSGKAISVGSPEVSFKALTNMKMIKVQGKAEGGKVTLEQTAPGKFSNLMVEIPIEKMSTGMDLRDKHMRERIFQKPDGTIPPIVFSASSFSCGNGICPIQGKLAIRGEERPFLLNLKMENRKFSAGGTVKLSRFGIKPPSQLGVTVKDDVAIELQGTVL